MSAYKTVQLCGSAVQVKQPEGSGTALIAEYAPYEFYLREAEEKYNARRAEFFDSLAEDKDLPKKAKKWSDAARDLLGYAQTLYIISSDNDEEKQRALQIMDRVSKECAVRKSRDLDIVERRHPRTDPVVQLRRRSSGAGTRAPSPSPSASRAHRP